MKKTLVKFGWLVSMDSRIGDITGGEILVGGDRILAVGRNLDAAADEVIDATGMIITPGLVNAHIHTWQAALRGVGTEWLGADYHRHMHGNMATRYTAEDAYLGNLYGALSQIGGGVTTIFDWCHVIRDIEMAERAIDGLEESGIRALFGHGTAKPPARPGELPYSHQPHPRERIGHLRKNRLPGNDGRITLAMAILGPEYGTCAVAKQDLALARELDLISTEHVWYGFNRTVDGEPSDPFSELARDGLLTSRHNVVHGNYLSDDVLDLLLENGVSITSTVMVELHGHGGEPLTGRVRDRGVMPSIGTDTGVIATDDMISEMRSALVELRYRHHRSDYAGGDYPPRAMPVKSREALQWATIGNARVMGMDGQIGSVTPGKKADLIMFDGEDDNIFPVHDPVHAAVEHASSANIKHVMIDGQFRKRDGKLVFPQARLSALKDSLRSSAERIMAEAGYRAVALG